MSDNAHPAPETSSAIAPEEHFLTINGRRHHYLGWGDAADPVLVLLHGGNTSARGSWTRAAPAFADRYRIIAPDHRGHGETDWDPEAGYNVANYVADFEQVIGLLHLAPFDLVGHSLGGIIALTYTARHPEMVPRLVLVDSGPRDVRSASAARAPVADRPLTFKTREDAHAFARATFPDAARDRPLDHAFMQRPDGTFTWRTDVAGLNRARLAEDPASANGYWPEFAALRCPVLVLRGGKSQVLSDDTVARMETTNPNVRVVTYSEARHWVHDDEPDRFVHDVSAFLAEGA
jgi:pimeloyl-ACP methyl ester carboxylesterase